MGLGRGKEGNEEVKKATFPTLLTMIVGPLFWLFLRPFWQARNSLCKNVWLQKYFAENIVAIWTSSLNKSKNQDKRTFVSVSLYEFVLLVQYVCQKCVVSWLSTVKTLLISRISGARLDLHLGESTFSLVLSHPMDQSFSSILQTQVELGCKLPCLYIFFFNWAAKVMLNMLFNAHLKIKQGNTEIRLEEKRGNIR